jgi:hypothetical protein
MSAVTIDIQAYQREQVADDSSASASASADAAPKFQQQRRKRQNVVAASMIVAKKAPMTNRRDSEVADTRFMRRMAKRHSSELVDNLQKKSYKDINAEFWDTHMWYLACVVCFVTLNVLYTTSYIRNQPQ